MIPRILGFCFTKQTAQFSIKSLTSRHHQVTYPSFHADQFSWCESVSLSNDRNNVHFIVKLLHKLNIKRLESEGENTNSIEKRQ